MYPSRRRRILGAAASVILTSALSLSSAAPAGAATTNPNVSEREQRHAALSRRAATEGMVLLDNAGSALPLPDGGNVALFGVGAHATVKGGTGSGSVNNRATVNVRDGLESAGYTVTTNATYYDAMVAAYEAGAGSGDGLFSDVDYASFEQALTAGTVKPTNATETAIFVVARNSGEGADREAVPGDYYLTDIEEANIRLIGQTYDDVVVILNTGGILDTKFYEEINDAVTDPAGGTALDSLLLMSQAGQESGHALVDVLSGDVTPSGKLTDTWASDYDFYPASETFALNDDDPLREEYTEGIYVGYRFFDSFYASLAEDPASVVSFPFGFGLSYTEFSIAPGAVTIDDGRISVKATVTNTGDTYSGKEVAQVYFSAPDGALDKPYQELAGFAKTDVLAPGESQEVDITFQLAELASYDEARAAYVLEAGDYVLRVGNGSRSTRVASVLQLKQTRITEQLSNQANDEAPSSEFTADPADFYSYSDEAKQIAAAPRLAIASSDIATEDNTSPFRQDVRVAQDSPYYPIDRSPISSVPVYVDPVQSAWENTGAAYQPKPGEKVVNVTTVPDATLWDVEAGRVSMEQFVAGLSVEQLAHIVEGATAGGTTLSATGAAGYTTPRYEDLGIASMSLVDGPAGVRITPVIETSPKTYQWATAFPIGTMLSQTWNLELIEEVGRAVGAEMAEFGATIWLAPSFNLHRDPLNGRNFEYHSEDPLVSGVVAAAITQGVQSNPGLGVAIKHYAANNQETERFNSNSVVGERALRENYLRAFEIVVKQAHPMAVMSSYNKINGTYVAGDYDLLYDILRGEWGFDGLVMTDWTGIRAGAINTMYAGNDLIMPGGNPGEMINETIQRAPDLDVNGLPVYTRREQLFGTFVWVTHFWGFNGITPSATGAESFTTTVDETTDLTQIPASGTFTRNEINNEIFTPRAPYASVDEAYREISTYLSTAGQGGWGSSAALTTQQAAGITLSNVVREDPSDQTSPVVSYTVTVRGDYSADGYNMRLGDLQRSAANVLNIVMQSASFQMLADQQGIPGVNVGVYGDGDAEQFLQIERGPITKDSPPPSATPRPVVTVTARPDLGFTPQRPYEVPGYHEMNGRRWFTECEYYSQTVRCRTNIFATQVKYIGGGKYESVTGWTFNNLTYLPFMTRAQWAKNPLGVSGEFTSNGRKWRTECDTATTGRGGCRSYLWVPNVVRAQRQADSTWTYSTVDMWVFNNLVRFRER